MGSKISKIFCFQAKVLIAAETPSSIVYNSLGKIHLQNKMVSFPQVLQASPKNPIHPHLKIEREPGEGVNWDTHKALKLQPDRSEIRKCYAWWKSRDHRKDVENLS